MDLTAAQKEIQGDFKRMHVAYLGVVFDEWAILAGGSKQKGIIPYVGPRPDTFRQDLPKNAEPLRQALSGQELHESNIEFTPQAEGRKHDAVIKIGPNSYLLCNHTGKTIAEFRESPRWLRRSRSSSRSRKSSVPIRWRTDSRPARIACFGTRRWALSRNRTRKRPRQAAGSDKIDSPPTHDARK